LLREATKYAAEFSAEEDTNKFWVGFSNYPTNRAFVWAIEAARCLAGSNDKAALKLLEMAVQDVRDSLTARS
jgi:hypothetical protein